MPWFEVVPSEEKKVFINDFLRHRFYFRELCRRYNVSPKTGYKFVHRFKEEGLKGLENRSSRPHTSPFKTDESIEQAIVEIRQKYTDRGGKKILQKLLSRYPDRSLPSITTINNIISRHGLITEHRRKKPQHHGKPISTPQQANDLWGIDYKGQFRTGDGNYCYPLTISDIFSRYIISCHGLLSPNLEDSKAVFERIFREFGLPLRIRTDNGTPFASPNTLGRLSQLSVWWIRLGIFPELIEPGSPQQNGIHERMHKTLKKSTTHPAGYNLRSQQRKFNAFVDEFNNDRPHESLGQKTPATFYAKSPRSMPSKLSQVEYPAHFKVRLVSTNGGIRWNKTWINVTRVLEKQYIGLEEIDDDIYDVFFGPVLIGRLESRTGRIMSRRSNYSFNLDYNEAFSERESVT
jgi:putative transposase